MTLPEILRETLRLIDRRASVTIARAGEHAYQVRFTLDERGKHGYVAEGRRWMDGPSDRRPWETYVGWSRWSKFLGFGVDAILADDWRFL